MIALIMAGGVGSRFWPASTHALPKQYLPILGSKSMIQLSFERLKPLFDSQDIYVVSSSEQLPLIRKHLQELPQENIIVEPFGMNTAPCLALSLAELKAKYPMDTSLLVLPADHYIRDAKSYLESLKMAEQASSNGNLLTFGIQPHYPATGYGYIQAGDEIQTGIQEVTQFKEKPDLQTAISFLNQGNFYWNSGMFCFTLESLNNAFKMHLPQALILAEQVVKTAKTDASTIHKLYSQMPRVSIDIGIMEKAENRAVIPVDYGWSDVGSWKALAELSESDQAANSFQSGGMALNSKGNYVQTSKFTALIDVDELCIIESETAILICPKDSSEKVKDMVELLKEHSRDDLL